MICKSVYETAVLDMLTISQRRYRQTRAFDMKVGWYWVVAAVDSCRVKLMGTLADVSGGIMASTVWRLPTTTKGDSVMN